MRIKKSRRNVEALQCIALAIIKIGMLNNNSVNKSITVTS